MGSLLPSEAGRVAEAVPLHPRGARPRLNDRSRFEHSRQADRAGRHGARPADELHARHGAALPAALHRNGERDRPRRSDPQARIQTGRQARRCPRIEPHRSSGTNVIAPANRFSMRQRRWWCSSHASLLPVQRSTWRAVPAAMPCTWPSADGASPRWMVRPLAIELLRGNNPSIDARVVDLETGEFETPAGGLRPGSVLLLSPAQFDSSHEVGASARRPADHDCASGRCRSAAGYARARLPRRTACVLRRLAHLALSGRRTGRIGAIAMALPSWWHENRPSVHLGGAWVPYRRWERGRGGALDGTGPRGWIRVASQRATTQQFFFHPEPTRIAMILLV